MEMYNVFENHSLLSKGLKEVALSIIDPQILQSRRKNKMETQRDED